VRTRYSVLTALGAVIVGVVIAGAATLLSSPNDSKAAPRRAPVAVADTHSTMPDQVADLVNEQRVKAGCAPLVVDPRLVQSAQEHSRDMAERHYFHHTTPEGLTFRDRIENAGYSNPGTAENMAQGHKDAKHVMAKWMASAEHRVNILNCAFSRTGVGLAEDGMYWTQDFGMV
jgi:uncharacterized protein YkwD